MKIVRVFTSHFSFGWKYRYVMKMYFVKCQEKHGLLIALMFLFVSEFDVCSECFFHLQHIRYHYPVCIYPISVFVEVC